MKHLESQIQKNCVMWFRLRFKEYEKLLFAVPNGGYRNAIEAKRMKTEGITSGVADLVLLIAKKGYNSLLIELKSKTGIQSKKQKEWQKQAEKHGNKYIICRSFDEFKNDIENYLK